MRTFVHCGFDANNNIDLTTFQSNPVAWFAEQRALGSAAWLLAYAEDGVIWGKLAGGALVLPQTETPTLSSQTLLEARLFNAQGEIHLWRTAEGFSACVVTDMPDGHGAFDEVQRLWGTDFDRESQVGDGFTLLVDGREGLRHAVPFAIPTNYFTKRHPRFHPALIQTRHYFQVDQETSVTSIALSRLVSVKSESFDEYRKRVKSHDNK